MTVHASHRAGATDETPEQRRARRAAQHERDLATLAAGAETGWWDEHGRPAPWPANFFDHDTMEARDRPHAAPNESLKLLPQKA